MKKKPIVIIISLMVTIAPILSIATSPRNNSQESSIDKEVMICPGSDGTYVSQIVDNLGGGDALFHEGLNGIDIYDYLGYV